MADVSWLFDELQPLTQENHLSISNGRTPASGLAGLPLAQVERQTILDTKYAGTVSRSACNRLNLLFKRKFQK
ncbi:MAG: hypothetical protein ACYSQZ_04390 [Planctomycetota bacterium]